MPCRRKTKNTKPHNAYDGTKYAQELDRGNTILKKYGNPQTQICCFGRYIADIYEDARLINITVGEPRLGNVNQIHDEILKKLESMAHTRQRDTKIGGYPIPYCCELETLQQMYTAQLDPTLLEGVVGTTAAPEPLSSTMASEPPESTAPVPEKKITLDEYNHRKALKLQQTVASPNLDENGERLDYDDFEPDDDPDNIQIDYQTPAPSLASSPQTSIPPLEDAPMPMSPATT